MKILCLILMLTLSGCGDRYSLNERRGPDPQGFTAANPLILPPDYLLRAPEKPTEKQPEKPAEEPVETPAETPAPETPATEE